MYKKKSALEDSTSVTEKVLFSTATTECVGLVFDFCFFFLNNVM